MQVEALWLSAGRDRAGRSPGPPAGQWSLGVTPCGDSTAGQEGDLGHLSVLLAAVLLLAELDSP